MYGILQQLPSEIVFHILSYLDFTALKPLIFFYDDVDHNLPSPMKDVVSLNLPVISYSSSSSCSGSSSSSSDNAFCCSLPIKHLFGDEFGVERFGIYLRIRFIDSIPPELELSDLYSFSDMRRKLEQLLVLYNPMMSRNLHIIKTKFEQSRTRIKAEYKILKYLRVTIDNENFMEVCRNFRHASKLLLENWGNFGYLSESVLRSQIPGDILVAFKEVYKNLVKPLKNIYDEKTTSRNPYLKALVLVLNSMNECAKYFKMLNRGLNHVDSRLSNDFPIPVELFAKFWKYLDNPLEYEPLLHMVTCYSTRKSILIDICNYISNLKPSLPPHMITTDADYEKFFGIFKLFAKHNTRVDRYAIFDLLFFESFEEALKKTLYFKNNTMKIEDLTDYIYTNGVIM